MTPSHQCTRQHLCIVFLALLCLLSYLMYSNLDVNLTSFSLCKTVSRQEEEGNATSSLQLPPNPNRTSSDEQSGPRSVVRTEEEDPILILMWFWPFGSKVELRCSEWDMEGCRLTDDRSAYHQAHAVMFHHRDIHYGLDNMPREPRPWFQKWIWFDWESPANSPHIPELNDLFNLTSSYRLDSRIPVPYGYLAPVAARGGEERFELPEKDKLVCWVVSNWNPQYKRVQVYEEMKNHVEIALYGRAFERPLIYEEYVKLMPSCKFYLSWENSIDRDYLSDKLYDPMRMGTVPVVLGPPRTNYEDHVPGDSFIHVDDFASPKELAERLIYLGSNHTEYMKYFEWRGRYKVHQCSFVSDQVCRSCRHLKTHKGYEGFHNLSKWYWG